MNKQIKHSPAKTLRLWTLGIFFVLVSVYINYRGNMVLLNQMEGYPQGMVSNYGVSYFAVWHPESVAETEGSDAKMENNQN